ncbi:MAG: hypothetical protein Q8896_02880 [Bacteroidota bacterium]|nr:hypothetical protein [Bacteroidota bacterium]
MIISYFRYKYRYGFRRFGIHTFFITALSIAAPVLAQHTAHEIGFSFAYAGQAPFVTSGDDQSSFFRQPLILNLRYQVATNYVQSLSVVLERISEERSRLGLWNDVPNSVNGAYNADIAERLTMTTLGLEGLRTLIRTDIFRLGVGIGLGYGFGGATASVRKITDGSQQTFESCDSWNGFLISVFARGRVTVYSTNSLDVGITLTSRLWGFPTISPLTDCQSSYNGPSLRSVFEIGYLAGVSVGLK